MLGLWIPVPPAVPGAPAKPPGAPALPVAPAVPDLPAAPDPGGKSPGSPGHGAGDGNGMGVGDGVGAPSCAELRVMANALPSKRAVGNRRSLPTRNTDMMFLQGSARLNSKACAGT